MGQAGLGTVHDVSGTIRDYIVNELMHDGDSASVDGRRLLDEGIIDSFSLQQLIIFLEREFDIVVDDDHLHPDHFESVEAIAGLVNKLRSQG